MVRRLIAMLAVAMVMAIVGIASFGGVAAADEPDYTDPTEVETLLATLEASDDMKRDFLALPADAQQAVVDVVVNNVQVADESSTVVSGLSGASADSGDDDCHSKHASRYAYAISKNIKIWKYTSKTYWCFDGTEITNDPSLTTIGKVYGLAKLFWDFEGTRTSSQSGGEGDRRASDFAEGHFTLDIPVDISVNVKKLVTISDSLDVNWYPSIWKYINGDGSWSYETDLDHD